MAYPKIHADANARNRASMAAYRARQKEKTPIQRLAEKEKMEFAYLPDETREVAAIRNLIRELETRAERLNASLKARIDGKPEFQKIAGELEIGFTKIQLPTF